MRVIRKQCVHRVDIFSMIAAFESGCKSNLQNILHIYYCPTQVFNLHYFYLQKCVIHSSTTCPQCRQPTQCTNLRRLYMCINLNVSSSNSNVAIKLNENERTILCLRQLNRDLMCENEREIVKLKDTAEKHLQKVSFIHFHFIVCECNWFSFCDNNQLKSNHFVIFFCIADFKFEKRNKRNIGRTCTNGEKSFAESEFYHLCRICYQKINWNQLLNAHTKLSCIVTL